MSYDFNSYKYIYTKIIFGSFWIRHLILVLTKTGERKAEFNIIVNWKKKKVEIRNGKQKEIMQNLIGS